MTRPIKFNENTPPEKIIANYANILSSYMMAHVQTVKILQIIHDHLEPHEEDWKIKLADQIKFYNETNKQAENMVGELVGRMNSFVVEKSGAKYVKIN
jgi:hypothetical protein